MGQAQDYTIQLQGPEANLFQQKSNLDSTPRDSSAARDALREAQANLLQQGYVLAGFDSLRFEPKRVIAWVVLGPCYRWVSIRSGNVPPELMNQSRLQERQWMNRALDPKLCYPAFERIIRACEDNGFPFASIRFDSLQEKNGGVSAVLNLQRGPYITLDSVIVGESPGIARHVILRYLGLREGMAYNESRLLRMSTRLKELPYVEEVYPWRMNFTQTRNTLNLYVKSKSANRADALLGAMPNNDE
ncbi:MAG: hypothetical protein FGM54_12065, partial [Chitinophagaceae bacterium]|nr:hypothetical protein [Chitinophagaceae bacterium]